MRTFVTLAMLAGTMSTADAATLQIQLAGDFYQGGPSYEVLADEAVIGSGTLEKAIETFEYEISGRPSQLSVRFTNDAAAPLDEAGKRGPDQDRNLVIKSVKFDGYTNVGSEFRGDKTTESGSDLILYANTVATLSLPRIGVLEAPTDLAETVPAAVPPESIDQVSSSVTEASDTPPQTPTCTAEIAITGYATGVARPSPEQQSILDKFLHDPNCQIVVTGYSSTSGPSSKNLELALDRAQGVLDYLVESGKNFSFTEVSSAGETDQFGNSQAANRRVVVKLR